MKICKQIITLGLLLLFAWAPLSQAQEDELLPPEEAFSLSAWIEGDNLGIFAWYLHIDTIKTISFDNIFLLPVKPIRKV